MAGDKKTCFVVMGFGTKTDPQTGRTINLDKSYRGVIKPAAKDAGLECVRADEIVHSGSIELTMYQQLLEADVVVADISTCNPNAMYELGVRHALRPYTTVIVAEDKIVYPFDVGHIVIRKYAHLGTAIDVEEAERFRAELADALTALVNRPEPDSPVYTILARLKPPLLDMIEHAPGADGPAPEAGALLPADETLSAVTLRAEQALDEEKFIEAKALYATARSLRPGDPYLAQRLALATYKSAQPTPLDALAEAKAIILELDPEVSNDPETLGLWGSLHKQLWLLTHDRADLDIAIHAHERGFDIRNDSYNGVNLAYLFNVRARVSEPAEQIADYINAQRVRRRVIALCEDELKKGVANGEDRYWAKATLVEACVGIGDFAAAEEWHRQAQEEDVPDWMRKSALLQLNGLRELLVPSPLDLIRSPVPATD